MSSQITSNKHYLVGAAVVGGLCVMAIILSVNPSLMSSDGFGANANGIPKKIGYQVEVSNPTNQVKTNVPVWLAMPNQSARQSIEKLEVSESYELVPEISGNDILKLTLEKLNPYESRIVSINVWLSMSEHQAKTKVENKTTYTKADKYINADHPKIVEVATLLQQEDTQETARATLDWVSKNMEYAGFISEDRGALYALENKSGDCSEYMSLYSALLRANDIPTRNIGGFIVSSNKKLKAAEYHNWVEVYMDGAWRVVDPQNNKFLEQENNYIAMRTIDHSNPGEFDNSQQLIKAEEGVNIELI